MHNTNLLTVKHMLFQIYLIWKNLYDHKLSLSDLIHIVGAIPATGRIKASPSQPSVPLSAANSLQFNQLIGGGISPSVISSHQNGASSNAGSRTSTVFTSAGPASGLPPAAAASASNSHNQHSPAHNLMIGDYVQGNMGNVLGNSFNRHQ